jgi:hypothetical protein
MKHSIGFAYGAILLALLPGLARTCDVKTDDPCGRQTEWNEFETIRLQMAQFGMPTPSIWYVQSSQKNHDLRVDFDSSDPHSQGTIMMVEGSVFVSKGVELTPGAEIDSLDSPVLAVILTGKVLSRALPGGPSALAGKKQQIKFEDKSTGIQFATPSAEGFISAPWSVTGTVTPNSDGSVDFSLALKYPAENEGHVKKEVTMSLSGNLKHNSDFHIDDAMSLGGWTVLGVGPIVEKTPGGGTRIDYGAKPTATTPTTIADIRKQLAKENSPGEPDPSNNFAGFWKEKCEDTFGLRIKPADQPAMYTVTFCGPGGCGDEQNERKTYIKGDKRYHIVSKTELQVGPSESRSNYKKCSEGMLP